VAYLGVCPVLRPTEGKWSFIDVSFAVHELAAAHSRDNF
jgi:hypothetical protein